jgi:hypothetical protein
MRRDGSPVKRFTACARTPGRPSGAACLSDARAACSQQAREAAPSDEEAMFKQLSMMKRKPGLSMEQFIEQYESRHAKFGEVLFANANHYVRRYVRPQRNPLTGELKELDFDVIMEIWWESEAEFQEAMKSLATSDLLPQIRASGEALFASHDNPAFTVEERETPLARRT